MKERLLRDLKRNTELLILVEILENPDSRLKDISERLGITVQAVSQYISTMREDGLISTGAKGVTPTRKGMQIMQEHFVRIKESVDDLLRRIRVIDTCVAYAGKKISKGQKVGLTMKNGRLMAYPNRRSSSTGEAMEDAMIGDDVLVGSLEGILEMDLGKLLIVELPSERDGGSKASDLGVVTRKMRDFSSGILVAGDVAGSVLLGKASGMPHAIHAPVETAMSALSKGVDVVFCGSKDSVDQLIEEIDNLKKETGYEITWKSVKV